MGFFDSKSTTRNETVSQNAGFSEVSGPAVSVNVKGGGKKSSTPTTVNLLDGGAIAKSYEFAEAAMTSSARQVELAGAGARDLVKESIAAVSENARSETENVSILALKWGALAFIAYAALRAFGKGF